MEGGIRKGGVQLPLLAPTQSPLQWVILLVSGENGSGVTQVRPSSGQRALAVVSSPLFLFALPSPFL